MALDKYVEGLVRRYRNPFKELNDGGAFGMMDGMQVVVDVDVLREELATLCECVRELDKKGEIQREKLREKEYLLCRSEEQVRKLVERIKELSTEYVALLEKCRWRKKSKEAAARIGMSVEAYSPQNHQLYFAAFGAISDDWYWRPIDLPENI